MVDLPQMKKQAHAIQAIQGGRDEYFTGMFIRHVDRSLSG